MSAKVGPALFIIAVGAVLAWAFWDVVPNDAQPTGPTDSATTTVTTGRPASQPAPTTHPELDRIELELSEQWSDPNFGARVTATCTTRNVTELLCDVSDPQLGGNGPTLVVTVAADGTWSAHVHRPTSAVP